MKKMKTRIAALLGALALTAWGTTGCFNSASGSDDWSDNNSISANRESISAPAAAGTVTVSGGGVTYSGNSIVDAFAAFASVSSGDITVTLAPGTYDVPFGKGLNYNGGANIKIQGTGTAEYGLDVLIKGRGKDQLSNKTRPVLEVEGTGSLVLENVTIQNTTRRSEVTETSSSGSALTQAEALGFDSSGTVAAYNCSFLSHQDTVRTISKSWFYNCYIEGDVDFIWMEAGSIVGLYEECKIYIAGDDEKSECYVLAPRIDLTSKVGKGNVIYKSRIIVGDGVTKAYLFRNPWSKTPNTLYNQGAVVDTEISGTLHSDLAKYDAWGHDAHDPQHLGWKVDSAIAGAYSSRLSSIGTLDATTKANEYGGREAILNRMYNLEARAYERDAVTYWNIGTIVGANGWSVTQDTSSSKLAGDAEEKSTQTYKFNSLSGYSKGDAVSSAMDAEGNEIPAMLSGWKYHGATYGIYAGTGSTIKIPVVDSCTIKTTVSYIGNSGTLTVSYLDKDQAKTLNTATIEGENGNCGETVTYTYDGGSETAFVIKVTDSSSLTTYISSIEVAYNGDVSAKLKELGKKYAANTTYMFPTWDEYKSAAQNTAITTTKPADSGSGSAMSFTDVKWHGTQYGLTGGEEAVFHVPVTGPCSITATVSYKSSVHIECGENSSSTLSNMTGDLTVKVNSAGTADVTVKGGTWYISKLYVSYTD